MKIIYPLLVMVVLTVLISLRLYYLAIKEIINKKIHIKQFRIYDGEISNKLESARQHYKNMFEMPILFYLLCILLISTNIYNDIDIFCAWSFVIFRILHSLSRIPNKNIYIRFGYFLGSIIALLVGWINFSINIANVVTS